MANWNTFDNFWEFTSLVPQKSKFTYKVLKVYKRFKHTTLVLVLMFCAGLVPIDEFGKMAKQAPQEFSLDSFSPWAFIHLKP